MFFINDIVYSRGEKTYRLSYKNKYNIGESLVAFLNEDFDELLSCLSCVFTYSELFDEPYKKFAFTKITSLLEELIDLFLQIVEACNKTHELTLNCTLGVDCYDINRLEGLFEEPFEGFYSYVQEEHHGDIRAQQEALTKKYNSKPDLTWAEYKRRYSDEFIAEVEDLRNGFMQLFIDILNIKKIYINFFDNYAPNGKLTEKEFASAILRLNDEFEKTKWEVPESVISLKDYNLKNNFLAEHTGKNNKTRHEVNADGVLTEIISFENIGDFIYYEFFKTFESGNVIKRCKNCKRFFLNTSKYDIEYCDEVYDFKAGKTCREMGAENTHAEKVKNNPVWLIYRRAYKAHYARVLKKTMTKSEFSEWGDMAIALREKALNGEIPFDEYERELKK